MGVPFTEGTSYETAAKIIEALLEDLAERGDPRATEWESYESLLASFDDRDELRDIHEIKRPSAALLKRAIEELLAEKISLKRLEDEPELVRDRLLRLKPALALARRN